MGCGIVHPRLGKQKLTTYSHPAKTYCSYSSVWLLYPCQHDTSIQHSCGHGTTVRPWLKLQTLFPLQAHLQKKSSTFSLIHCCILIFIELTHNLHSLCLSLMFYNKISIVMTMIDDLCNFYS